MEGFFSALPQHAFVQTAIATLLGAVLSVAGLGLSYGPDLPAGPTITLLAGGVYVLSAMIRQALDRRRPQLASARSVWPREIRE